MREGTIGSLFAGIGGLELGLEAALGWRTVWQVEQAEYPRRVLAKHWPDADRSVTDVHDAGAATLPRVALVCGGFPCVDLSTARRDGAGLDGDGSGLWWQMRRVVDELEPGCVVVENVAPRWRSWVPVVRGELGRLGYASVPLRVRAADVGAPHQRDRCFVVAWRTTAHADEHSQPTRPVHGQVADLRAAPGAVRDWREPPPGGFRVADGVPGRLDRLRAVGNAVVPQCAYRVGLRIRELAVSHA